MPASGRLGRPNKYGRPARAVTVTLPEDVLETLATIHADVGSAIVNMVERIGPSRLQPIGTTEIARYGNHAVIIVTPSRALRRLRGVQLVPIGDGRALISLDPSMSISALELQVRDALETGAVQDHEREALKSIADILRRGRASRDLTFEARTIIVLASKVEARGYLTDRTLSCDHQGLPHPVRHLPLRDSEARTIAPRARAGRPRYGRERCSTYPSASRWK